jgi:hypothetical protein
VGETFPYSVCQSGGVPPHSQSTSCEIDARRLLCFAQLSECERVLASRLLLLAFKELRFVWDLGIGNWDLELPGGVK